MRSETLPRAAALLPAAALLLAAAAAPRADGFAFLPVGGVGVGVGVGVGFAPPAPRRGGFCSTRLRMAAGGGAAASAASAQEGKRAAPSAKDPGSIRNVALVGHSHSGKTALAEWMLYDERVLARRPSDGSSSLDSDPVESARHSSVFSHYVRVPHRGSLLELADTPWGDFPSDAAASLDGSDSAVVVVSAADGVQAGTVGAYRRCRESGIGTMIALSKMDRPFADAGGVLEDIEAKLGVRPVPLQVARGGGEDFDGVVPLVVLDDDGNVVRNVGGGGVEGLDEAWTALEEAVAMTDDDLLVEYLETSELDDRSVLDGLRSGVRRGKILPLVYTSAERDLGVSELMDAMVAALPDPVEMREEALNAACEVDDGRCGLVPGVESGFAARVLHTIVDSFGSLSVLRVISNDRDDDGDGGDGEGGGGSFRSLPQEVANLRTGERIKMPSASASFGLCGGERLPLADGAHVLPGDVIAVPKMPESVRTNDILTVPGAAEEERDEIEVEAAADVLTPLSRPAEDVPLMAAATVTLPQAGGGGGGGGGGKKSGRGRSAGGGGDDRLMSALAAMAREDLALRVEQDSASGKLILRCMSGDHLRLLAARLRDRYGLEVELGRPPVQYRETLIKPVTNVEGRHKKQSGGSGQFGVCYISMEPLEEGAGVEFESRIKGGAISKPFISSVERGVREQLQSGGPLAGYPVTDVRVTLTDGKMHSVDSKDIAFQSAGRIAVRAALEAGGSRLLQPMERVTFVVDEKLQGDVNAIVSRQDGYVTSTGPSADGMNLEVEAVLPAASISDVSDGLRAASAGEGQFTSVFSHYQPAPDGVVEDVVADSAGGAS